MKTFLFAMAASLATTSFGLAQPQASTTILHCDFDAEPLNQLVGEGGASAGQPVSRGAVPAVVRATPFSSPSLELSDDWGTGARSVRFEFLDSVEISSGTLEISMNLHFQDMNAYTLYVREQGLSTVAFLSVTLSPDGTIRYGDLDSPGGTLIGSYVTGTVLPLVIAYDLDVRTYDLSLGGSLLLDDESLGPAAQGIGSVLVGLDHDPDAAGTLYVDDVVVTATDVPNAVDPGSWAAVKAAWR